MNNRHMILTVAVVTVVLLGFAICLTDESEAVDVSSSAALADELNNADGEKTITLTANITDLSTLTTIGNGADVTLDLAGFDISMTGDGRIVIDSGASLTVKDSSSTTVSEQGNVSGIKSEMIEVEGTLNIHVDPDDVGKLDVIKSVAGVPINGFTDNGRSFGNVVAYKARIRNIDCAIVVPERSHYADIIEIICQYHLRRTLSLEDGDRVDVKVNVRSRRTVHGYRFYRRPRGPAPGSAWGVVGGESPPVLTSSRDAS